jgi:hypothetical protein
LHGSPPSAFRQDSTFPCAIAAAMSSGNLASPEWKRRTGRTSRASWRLRLVLRAHHGSGARRRLRRRDAGGEDDEQRERQEAGEEPHPGRRLAAVSEERGPRDVHAEPPEREPEEEDEREHAVGDGDRERHDRVDRPEQRPLERDERDVERAAERAAEHPHDGRRDRDGVQHLSPERAVGDVQRNQDEQTEDDQERRAEVPGPAAAADRLRQLGHLRAQLVEAAPHATHS